MAVDFIVEDENMREVVVWIFQNVPFDRLYFYGSLPLASGQARGPSTVLTPYNYFPRVVELRGEEAGIAVGTSITAVPRLLFRS